MPMVQDFIKNNPDQFFIHEETGETLPDSKEGAISNWNQRNEDGE
ncbi:hypothetical protein HMPREF0758_1720 [Serratia odorifera DSM 4582]|uniref:Uncharacterized protein n=2 Tax=Serratia odorifera TaxID=618 RepID=D4E0M0_SEROD|nr:hypothetical protein HMPREF0758_1720 [Serratia odorifera DSM 4582]